MRFPFSDCYNFTPYPAPWNATEWNNHVEGCMVYNRDINFCQPIAADDCVNFQFLADDKGENIITIVDGSDTTTGTTANKVVCAGFGFNTKLAGQIIINTTDNTSTELIAPLNANDAGVTNDIFVSGDDFVLLNARSLVANNWFGSFDGTDYFINKVSDAVNDSQVRIITDSQVTIGQPYRITFTITNYAGGSAFVQFGTAIVGYIYGNGTYTFYGEMVGTGGITFASLVASDFVGTINLSTLEFYELEQSYQLVTMANVPEVLDILPDSFTLNPNTGIVTYSDCEALAAYVDGACLYFAIMKACQFENLIPCLPVWTLGAKTEYDGDACQLIATKVENIGDLIADYLPPCVEEGIEYNITFTVTGLTGSFIAGFGGVGGNLGTITTNGTYNYTVECESPITDGLQFYADSIDTSVIISEISIYVATPIPAFVSECFTVTDKCSIQIKFRNDSNVFGFDYTDDRYYNYIRICGRLRYGSMRVNDYKMLKSTLGFQKSTFADLSKTKDFIVNVIPPYLIKAIQTALTHTELWITDESGTIRYCLTENPEAEFNDNTETGKINVQLAEYNEQNSWQN